MYYVRPMHPSSEATKSATQPELATRSIRLNIQPVLGHQARGRLDI
jgi:hypothetical protein